MTISIDVMQLDEPLLEFGNNGEHFDVKAGLIKFGPISLRYGLGVHKDQIRVGLVGPITMLSHAKMWLERCQNPIFSEAKNKSINADFPGFKTVFRSTLNIAPKVWFRQIQEEKLENIFKSPNDGSGFKTLIDLYITEIQQLANMDGSPDVVIVCLPDELIKRYSTINTTPINDYRQINIIEPNTLIQLPFPGFEEMNEETEVAIEENDTLLHTNFRRALKARVMDIGIPIQIGTDNLFLDSKSNQDAATRAWNSCLALFYKGGGIPWRLKNLAPETCYVGISFHHYNTRSRHSVFSSIAQAFLTSGEGFALKGDMVHWDRENQDRNPHLTKTQAADLMERVLTQYYHQVGNDPVRLVLYKTSKFLPEEEAGFRTVLTKIPVLEMVNLRPSEFRLIPRGPYPPARGTVVKVNDSNLYLFTNGYYADWGTYNGAHVPVPYEIKILGDSDPIQTCTDILGLTKLNWNTAQPFTGTPIPLSFAKEVGGIMTHYAQFNGERSEPRTSYKFYM